MLLYNFVWSKEIVHSWVWVVMPQNQKRIDGTPILKNSRALTKIWLKRELLQKYAFDAVVVNATVYSIHQSKLILKLHIRSFLAFFVKCSCWLRYCIALSWIREETQSYVLVQFRVIQRNSSFMSLSLIDTEPEKKRRYSNLRKRTCSHKKYDFKVSYCDSIHLMLWS